MASGCCRRGVHGDPHRREFACVGRFGLPLGIGLGVGGEDIDAETEPGGQLGDPAPLLGRKVVAGHRIRRLMKHGHPHPLPSPRLLGQTCREGGDSSLDRCQPVEQVLEVGAELGDRQDSREVLDTAGGVGQLADGADITPVLRPIRRKADRGSQLLGGIGLQQDNEHGLRFVRLGNTIEHGNAPPESVFVPEIVDRFACRCDADVPFEVDQRVGVGSDCTSGRVRRTSPSAAALLSAAGSPGCRRQVPSPPLPPAPAPRRGSSLGSRSPRAPPGLTRTIKRRSLTCPPAPLRAPPPPP